MSGRVRAAVVGGLFAVLASSCGPERIPPPSTPAPSVYRPADAIPGDLDVAIRLDLKRLRSDLGPLALGALWKRLEGSDMSDPPAQRLMRDLFDRAETVWVAFRPGPSVELLDSVVVARGEFDDLDPRSYDGASPWGPPTDLGGDWRLFSRQRPEGRAMPAALYAKGTKLLVLASYAEIDAVERAVELRARDPHVDPPERGLVAFEARLRPLLDAAAGRLPAITKRFAECQRARGSADFVSDSLDAQIEIDCESETSARRASEAVAALLETVTARGGAAADLAAAVETSVTEATFSARWRWGARQLAALGALADVEAPEPLDSPR